ncbi:MAG: hypothetical protein ACI93R_003502, partial [Flavobacteriales bacterium]
MRIQLIFNLTVILFLLFSSQTLFAADSQASQLHVELSGLTSDKGVVRFGLYRGEENYNNGVSVFSAEANVKDG